MASGFLAWDPIEFASAAGKRPTAAVSEFMTTNPETVAEVDPLAFALHKMDAGGYRHLPVLANGHSIGMISVRDMLLHFTRLCKT